MAKFSERLRALRKEAGLSQAELARLTGTTKSSVNMYERGEREPGLERLEVFANYFNVDMDYLLGKSDIKNKLAWSPDTSDVFPKVAGVKNIIPIPRIVKKIPLYDGIACGDPMFADSQEVDLMELPDGIRADFALRCYGESMINAHIRDGDIVYIRKQEDVDDGEIAAVLIDDDATLKRVFHKPYGLLLMPANDAFEPMVYTGGEGLTIRIMGKAVACLSQVR